MKERRPPSALRADFLKHTPGGHEHNQQDHNPHGGGGSGGGSTGSSGGGADAAAAPAGRKWIDHKEGLPKDTEQHYRRGDRFTPEREELHGKIMDKYTKGVKSVPADKKPVALVMMGGTASGKSSIDKGINEDDFVQVDPDAVKGDIPEYHEAVSANARDAAFMVHEESGYLAKKIRQRAIDERKNVLIDGTGKNLNDYQNTIDQLREKGYEVTVMMPDLDVETAVARSAKRAERTGRYVPEAVIRDVYSKVPKNFEPIARKANNFFLFDNRGSKPRVVWSKIGDKEEVHDAEFVRRFTGRG